MIPSYTKIKIFDKLHHMGMLGGKGLRNFNRVGEVILVAKELCPHNMYSPFNAQEDTGVPFHRNFYSILRRDHKKFSYERRAYESVDEKSLS